MRKLSKLKRTFAKMMNEIEKLPNNKRELKVARRILEKIKYLEYTRNLKAQNL